LFSGGSDSQKHLGFASKEFLASFEDEEGDHEADPLKADGVEEDEDRLSAQAPWSDEQSAGSSLDPPIEERAMSITSPKLAGEEFAGGLGSPVESTSPAMIKNLKEGPNYLEQEMHEDGEYLIRPHLQPGERIRFRYNCERVVGLDKRDGIFLIGEKCLYVIENYIIEAGCIKEKLEERDLSVIDRALGVRTNSAGVADIHSTKQLETMDNAWPGGRAWAYSGGAWGKEKVGFFISFSSLFFLNLRFAVFLWFYFVCQLIHTGAIFLL
jgi:hypothetical protein